MQFDTTKIYKIIDLTPDGPDISGDVKFIEQDDTYFWFEYRDYKSAEIEDKFKKIFGVPCKSTSQKSLNINDYGKTWKAYEI